MIRYLVSLDLPSPRSFAAFYERSALSALGYLLNYYNRSQEYWTIGGTQIQWPFLIFLVFWPTKFVMKWILIFSVSVPTNYVPEVSVKHGGRTFCKLTWYKLRAKIHIVEQTKFKRKSFDFLINLCGRVFFLEGGMVFWAIKCFEKNRNTKKWRYPSFRIWVSFIFPFKLTLMALKPGSQRELETLVVRAVNHGGSFLITGCKYKAADPISTSAKVKFKESDERKHCPWVMLINS